MLPSHGKGIPAIAECLSFLLSDRWELALTPHPSKPLPVVCSTYVSLLFTGGISFLGLYVLVFLVSSLSPGKCGGSAVLPNSSAVCCELHSPTGSSLLFRCPKCPSTRYVYKWIPTSPPPKIGVILRAPTAHPDSVPPSSSALHSFNGFHPDCYFCLPLPFTFHGCQNRKRKWPMWPYHLMAPFHRTWTYMPRRPAPSSPSYLFPPPF